MNDVYTWDSFKNLKMGVSIVDALIVLLQEMDHDQIFSPYEDMNNTPLYLIVFVVFLVVTLLGILTWFLYVFIKKCMSRQPS
jgi:hypothetical protein